MKAVRQRLHHRQPTMRGINSMRPMTTNKKRNAEEPPSTPDDRPKRKNQRVQEVKKKTTTTNNNNNNTQDDADKLWNFDEILRHHSRPRNQIEILWADGTSSWEDVVAIGADAPEAVAEYAQKHNLIHKPVWKQFRQYLVMDETETATMRTTKKDPKTNQYLRDTTAAGTTKVADHTTMAASAKQDEREQEINTTTTDTDETTANETNSVAKAGINDAAQEITGIAQQQQHVAHELKSLMDKHFTQLSESSSLSKVFEWLFQERLPQLYEQYEQYERTRYPRHKELGNNELKGLKILGANIDDGNGAKGQAKAMMANGQTIETAIAEGGPARGLKELKSWLDKRFKQAKPRCRYQELKLWLDEHLQQYEPPKCETDEKETENGHKDLKKISCATSGTDDDGLDGEAQDTAIIVRATKFKSRVDNRLKEYELLVRDSDHDRADWLENQKTLLEQLVKANISYSLEMRKSFVQREAALVQREDAVAQREAAVAKGKSAEAKPY